MTETSIERILCAIGDVKAEAQKTRTEIAELRGEMREGLALRPNRDEITTTIKTTIRDYCTAHHAPTKAPAAQWQIKALLALVGAISALTAVIVSMS